jgi:hypothetical protein
MPADAARAKVNATAAMKDAGHRMAAPLPSVVEPEAFGIVPAFARQVKAKWE